MPPRTNRLHRCPVCQMSRLLCICGLIADFRLKMQALEMRTRIVVLMHFRETMTTTNTALLAGRMLERCDVRVRGDRHVPLSLEGVLQPDRPALFLYPSSEARELTPEDAEALNGEVTLIVPDGSWRQARKVAAREKALADVPHVKLPLAAPSQYRLRRAPRAETLSTFEAIARALGILEGPERGPRIQEELERVFHLMVERTLWSQGKLRPEECEFEIPREAIEAYFIAGAAGGRQKGGEEVFSSRKSS